MSNFTVDRDNVKNQILTLLERAETNEEAAGLLTLAFMEMARPTFVSLETLADLGFLTDAATGDLLEGEAYEERGNG